MVVKNGMTDKNWRNFRDCCTVANVEQLSRMKSEILHELENRSAGFNGFGGNRK